MNYNEFKTQLAALLGSTTIETGAGKADNEIGYVNQMPVNENTIKPEDSSISLDFVKKIAALYKRRLPIGLVPDMELVLKDDAIEFLTLENGSKAVRFTIYRRFNSTIAENYNKINGYVIVSHKMYAELRKKGMVLLLQPNTIINGEGMKEIIISPFVCDDINTLLGDKV